MKHLNLATLVVTELVTGTGVAYNCEVHGGVIYGTRWYGSLFSINVDGTGYEDIMKPSTNFAGLFIDTVNTRVLAYEYLGLIQVFPDPTMPYLPDDPSLFVTTPRPISLVLSWQPVDGATGYSVIYTIGKSGGSDNVISSGEFTDKIRHSVKNLQSGATYTVTLSYYDHTRIEILIGLSIKTTLVNLLGNYDSSKMMVMDLVSLASIQSYWVL